MKIKAVIPDTLPLKHIKWDPFIDLLWKAHATLARFDEILKRVKHPEKVFSVLTCMEALSSLHSQKIEASLEELLVSLAEGVKPSKDGPGITKIIHYKEALEFASHKILKSSLSNAFLCEIHKMIKQDTLSNQNGKFRDIQNWIGEEGCTIKEAYFLPPAPKLLHKTMENLKEYFFCKEKDPLVQLAIFFAQLLVIHPFMDGNGRVGRIFIPLFLFKKKLLSTPMFYLSAYFKKYRLQYFEKLYEISSKNAWEEWIRFFLKGIIESGEIQIAKANKILSLYRAMLEDVSDFKLGQEVVDHVFAHPLFKMESVDKKSLLILKKLQKKRWIVPYKKQSMVSVKKLLTIDCD